MTYQKMNNVTALPGVVLTSSVDAQPQQNVIAFIERLLEKAKLGEIQAIAVATVGPNNTTADGWEQGLQGAPNSHNLMAAISYLQNRLATRMNNSDC